MEFFYCDKILIMYICLNNEEKSLKAIVEKNSKYQKVMVLFDNSVSEIFLREIYEEIKDVCIYNKSDMFKVGDEIYDGYRLIIYICEIDNFLKSEIRTEEFINVFIAQNNYILPYFLNRKSLVHKGENYLLLNNFKIDIYMLSSFYFNIYFNCFRNLISGELSYEGIVLPNNVITQENLIKNISSMKENTFFVDVDIIKKQHIKYSTLIVVDILIIDSILLFLSSIKNGNLMLVDIYKSAKENYELIDKFYKFYQNDKIVDFVKLNFNYLYNFGLKTKNQLLEIMSLTVIDKSEIDDLISEIKDYSKNDNDIMAYLYLYNVFNV